MCETDMFRTGMAWREEPRDYALVRWETRCGWKGMTLEMYIPKYWCVVFVWHQLAWVVCFDEAPWKQRFSRSRSSQQQATTGKRPAILQIFQHPLPSVLESTEKEACSIQQNLLFAAWKWGNVTGRMYPFRTLGNGSSERKGRKEVFTWNRS